MGKSQKGSNWEREFSKRLSLWWTNNEKDDVFWRVMASGGRATVRMKSGKTTANQSGDIMATDPVGLPLIALCSLELKAGYNKELDFLTIVDGKGKKPCLLEQFMKQTYVSASQSGKKVLPILVIKRDRHNPVIGLDYDLYSKVGWSLPDSAPSILIVKGIYEMIFFTLDDFFKWFKPDTFKKVYETQTKE